jgi:biopolymer transport protein ExbD
MVKMKRSVPIKSGRKHYFMGWPDLTPLVDVLFLLLIFFMISSSFVQVSGIKVDLPQVGSTSTLGVQKSILTVVKTGNDWEINFNDQVIKSWDKLKEKLAEISAMSNNNVAGTIIVRADRNISFGIISRIMVLAEKSQLSIFVATLPTEQQSDATFNPEAR